MFKKSLSIFLLYLFVAPAYAALELQIDRDNIASDETLTLVITSHDHLSMTPDLSPLEKDFHIIGTSQSSQFNMINGATRMETQWQITLMPKHDGDILLPAISAGNEKTPPRLIHVATIKKNLTSVTQSQNIFIEANITPKELYIQEQFVYTLKVFYNRSIENPYLTAPDLADAKITQNGEDIIYTTARNGKYYQVVERSYLITPKHIGHFQINPPTLKGYLEPSHNMPRYGFPSQVLTPIKIVGPTLALTVKPKPANFNSQWLPAKKLTLSESWEPPSPTFREGEPVTRTVEVNAEGITGEQLPNLVISSSPHLNSYPQQPTRQTNSNAHLPVGKLTQKIVYIPTLAGKVTLPAIKVRWWNSRTKQEQTAILPAKLLKVLPALPATTMQPIHAPTASSLPVVEAKRTKSSFWPVVAIISILAWITTIWLWRRQLNRTRIPASLPHLQKQLKQACNQHKAKQARSLFLKWAALYWKNSALHALADVIGLLEREQAFALAAEIMQLEAIFYSKNKKQWHGEKFWQSFQTYLQAQEEKPPTSDPLPPLHLSLLPKGKNAV